MASDRKEFFVSLDLKNNSLLNFVVDVASETPTKGGVAGQLKSYGGKLYISNGTDYVELGEAGVASQIRTDLDALTTKVGEVKTTVDTAAGNIITLTGKMDTAESNIGTLQAGLATAKTNITGLQGRMDTAEGEIDALQLTVNDENNGLVKKVNDNTTAIGTKANSADVYTKTVIDGKIDTINESIDKKANSADVYTKTAIDTTFTNYYKKSETYSQTEIDSKISTASTKAYRIKGSVNTFAELPETGQVEGDVWNVLSSFTIGGEKNTYPAGTNVVWTDSGWDPLGGIVDLSPYALASAVNTMKTELERDIALKVAQSDYDTKMSEIDTALSKKATIEALNTGLDTKVDTTTYANDKSALEASIGTKVTANKAITAGTYPKITYDAKGLVTGGADLSASDIPTITADKISDFETKARAAVRYQTTSTSGAIIPVAHNLNVQFPHVSVYNSGGEEIGVHVKVNDSNNITVSGNEDLGTITIVVSA